MSKVLTYRGYTGTVEFSEDDNILYGKVQGIRSLISYEGETIKEIAEDFHGAVDDYLVLCEEAGETPEIPYKGSFNVRVKPELHREAAIYAYTHDCSLNKFVEESIEKNLYNLGEIG